MTEGGVMTSLEKLADEWEKWALAVLGRKNATPEMKAQATGWRQCAGELREMLKPKEEAK